MRKFKPGQEVVLLNLMVNSKRMDAVGTVMRYLFVGNPTRVMKVEVYFHECYLYLDEAQILTYNEWCEGNKPNE